jgi:TRAP-type C4-dicarboxylate transport system permease small subunit
MRVLISLAGILACSTLTVGAFVGMFGLLTDPGSGPDRLKVACMYAVVPIGCLWWTWTAVRSLWGEVRRNDVGDEVSSDDAPEATDESRMT